MICFIAITEIESIATKFGLGIKLKWENFCWGGSSCTAHVVWKVYKLAYG